MKLSALSVPIFMSGLLLVAIWGFSQLTVQAGKTATQTSLEMLRQQLEIQRLQEQLAARSRGKLLEQLEVLPDSKVPSTAPPEATLDVSQTPSIHPEPRIDATQPKPWPTS